MILFASAAEKNLLPTGTPIGSIVVMSAFLATDIGAVRLRRREVRYADYSATVVMISYALRYYT